MDNSRVTWMRLRSCVLSGWLRKPVPRMPIAVSTPWRNWFSARVPRDSAVSSHLSR